MWYSNQLQGPWLIKNDNIEIPLACVIHAISKFMKIVPGSNFIVKIYVSHKVSQFFL